MNVSQRFLKPKFTSQGYGSIARVATNALAAAKRLNVINSELLIESEWRERYSAPKGVFKSRSF